MNKSLSELYLLGLFSFSKEVIKWQRLMNVTGVEDSTDQKKGGLDPDGKQKSQ